jgi:hypothetical protein
VLSMLDEPEAVAREMGQFLLTTVPGPATDRHETVETRQDTGALGRLPPPPRDG